MTCPVLILAAGNSSRMRGADKLLEPVGGQPLLRRVVEAAIAAGLEAWVALPRLDHPRSVALEGLDFHPLVLGGSAEGLGGTLREGVAALPPCSRFMGHHHGFGAFVAVKAGEIRPERRVENHRMAQGSAR